MSKKPLKSTDRRRNSHAKGVKETDESSSGSGSPLASLFNDRRRPNGHGRRTS